MPRTNQETLTVEPAETVADESTEQTSLPPEGSMTVTEANESARNEALQQYLWLQALNAQDPIVYRYNDNASDGERLIGVPLSDLRQSVWDELPSWSKQAVTKSHLYTKVEA